MNELKCLRANAVSPYDLSDRCGLIRNVIQELVGRALTVVFVSVTFIQEMRGCQCGGDERTYRKSVDIS